FDGFFPFYWDNENGKVWIEVDRWNEEFLYVPSLQSGIGSNPIGLDRGLLGGEKVVKFVRIGPKVLLVEPNQRYRAQTKDQSERKAVEDSFAQSVIWGFEIEQSKGDRILIDATPFLVRDSMGIVERLSSDNHGSYKLDDSRSAIHLDAIKNFPKNSEFEATVTFTGRTAGSEIRSVAPSSDSITVRVHHSFVQLPDSNYTPREFDPRAGTFVGASFFDYATPIEKPIRKQFIARHRLKKRHPSAANSPAEEPIIYYIDPGVPEPIKTALIDGANWWNEAFEAIGFQNAFRIEELPEGADPMDVRYNIIQWVHRATRGWSYGMAVVDPRTGEIIKGKVTLGSLRVRQDYLIAQGLLSPFANGDAPDPRMAELALARLRQLSAHEVGHTLGFSHNFATSAKGRSSVMDYPHPKVHLDENGEIDLSKAYSTGIGTWDKVAVAYSYQEFPDETLEREALNSILEKARKDGHVYITDQDARPMGGAHPSAHLWDNGSDPIAELNQVIKIRSLALNRISQSSIRQGEPLATIEEVLTPIYLFHRYQTEATAKLIGGIDYEYTVKGSNQPLPRIIDPATQSRALEAILKTLAPEFLEIPEKILALIPPRPQGYPRSKEVFQSRMNVAFDPLSAAEAAGHHTLAGLFNVQRANRLILQKARDQARIGLNEVIKTTLETTWKAPRQAGLRGEIQKIIEFRILQQLFGLAVSTGSMPETRAQVSLRLDLLKAWIHGRIQDSNGSPDWEAHYHYALKQFGAFEEHPNDFRLAEPSRIPAGSPIGEIHCSECLGIR
ncbi:zinc-dependent metalloprotease, partial [Verrucomicrobia bacterium]|nr:zinc-dependent metalloprotease [Verrucomicrobiota bacterium]